jgi:hypothetical protein
MITSRRVMRSGFIAQMRVKRNIYRLLEGKPERERERSLGKLSHGCVDNIKIDL